MKTQQKALLLSIATLFFAGTIAQAKSETYIIDPLHTNARFTVDHHNTSSNVGGFFELTGDLKYDEKNHTGSIKITIPIKSLQTSSHLFTEDLKGEDFFNEKKYPEMTFSSNSWTTTNGKLTTISGYLSLLGKTNPVVLKVNKFNCYLRDTSKSQKTCGADLSTTIDRTQWGMNSYTNIGNSKYVRIDIQVEAEQK